MSAYVIVDMEVLDLGPLRDYIRASAPTADAYGGRILVRAGKTEVLEGGWQPHSVVIAEFPTFEMAKAWWESPEYTAARALRADAANTNMIIVDGLPLATTGAS